MGQRKNVCFCFFKGWGKPSRENSRWGVEVRELFKPRGTSLEICMEELLRSVCEKSEEVPANLDFSGSFWPLFKTPLPR